MMDCILYVCWHWRTSYQVQEGTAAEILKMSFLLMFVEDVCLVSPGSWNALFRQKSAFPTTFIHCLSLSHLSLISSIILPPSSEGIVKDYTGGVGKHCFLGTVPFIRHILSKCR